MVEEKSKRKICVLIFHRSTLGQFHLAHEGVVNLDLMPPQLPAPGAAAPLHGISGVVGPKTSGTCVMLLSGSAEGRERAGRVHVGRIRIAKCDSDFQRRILRL